MSLATTTTRGFFAPSKYIQGPGEINNLPFYSDTFGKNVVVMIDRFLFDDFKPIISALYTEQDITFVKSEPEVTVKNIENLISKFKDTSTDVYVAVGGGKTIDTIKAIADHLGKKYIVVPTSASTDAPTSGISVVYTEEGAHSHEIFLSSNPDLVLVDSQIIANAPVRLLVSGMGDALATYFEAECTIRSSSEAFISNEIGTSLVNTLLARSAGELCLETLLEDGYKAKLAVEEKLITKAVENIIEANTLLSGFGFESVNVSAGHAVHDGLTKLPQTGKFLHGEKVAFGTLVLLSLMNYDKNMINKIYSFAKSVGLPITLSDLGVENATSKEIRLVANGAIHSAMDTVPGFITEDEVYSAIVTADKIGKLFKEGRSL